MGAGLQTGAIVGHRFRLDRFLGEGGMGAVWAASHVDTGERAALKVLRASLLGNQEMRKRFLAEARVAATIDHPAVVPILELFELADHTPVLVMELLTGETLAARLRAREPLALDRALAILTPVGSALAAAHERGIVHRDLKPDNVLLARTADGEVQPRVLDFGIAKLVDPAHAGSIVTKAGTALGTTCYMAPEQAAADPAIDHRADIWAFGVVTYECLSGIRPVEATNVGHFLKRVATEAITPLELLAPDAPHELTQLVGRMLAPDREDRPSDMAEIVAVLQRLAAR